ncbi:MAG: S-layer homology domain-containing protein [Eubacteriales bacterium]|jgi:hypothetical protein
MKLKRYISIVSALIFLFSLLAAIATGVPGSAEDPVVSLSYIQETFIPKILNQLDNRLSVLYSDNVKKTDSRIKTVISDAEKDLSIDTEKLKDQVTYDTYMRMLDNGFYMDSGEFVLLTLRAGQRVVVTKNSSFMVHQGSAVIGGREQKRLVNVTAAGEVNTNSTASRNARYVAVDDGFVSIKAVSDTVKISVVGNYQFVPEYLPQNSDIALTLKDINMFRGSNLGFELDREPTRLEALILFLRLIGEEKQALDYTGSHPFVDVPKWGGGEADRYVAYAYSKGYTKGISQTKFGANNTATLEQYLTFVLRSIGYRDGTDFEWTGSPEFAEQIGILLPWDSEKIVRRGFYRDHVVYISYYALRANLKNSRVTLIDDLVNKGVISQELARKTVSAHSR